MCCSCLRLCWPVVGPICPVARKPIGNAHKHMKSEHRWSYKHEIHTAKVCRDERTANFIAPPPTPFTHTHTLARCPIQSHTPTQAAKSLLTISSVLPELLLFLSFCYFVWLLKYLHLHLQSVNLFVFCLLDLWAFRIYSLFLRRTHTNSAPLRLTPDFQRLLVCPIELARPCPVHIWQFCSGTRHDSCCCKFSLGFS